MKDFFKNKSNIVVGIVIVLLIIIIILQYSAYHQKGTANSPESLSDYLSGLTSQIAGKPATNATSSTTASTAGASAPATSGSGSSSAAERPVMYALSPSTGSPGLTILITGYGFDHSVNYVSFGSEDAGLHSVNGLPADVVATEGSKTGTLLSFNVPYYAPTGLLCDSSGKNCTASSPALLPAGTYPVTVTSRGGTSNTLWFTIVH